MTPEYLKAITALVHAYDCYIQQNPIGADIKYTDAPIEVGQDFRPSDLITVEGDAKVLYVSAAHSASSICGLAGNLLLRAAHDIAHIKYNLKFTTEAELRLAELHWQELRGFIEPTIRPMAQAIFMADTAAQSLYEAKHGHFPKDQTKFVLGVLRAQGWL